MTISAKTQKRIKNTKRQKNKRNQQDVLGQLESGLADRVRSYFSNLEVQRLEIGVTALARWWMIPKSAALLIVSERAEI